MGLEDLFEHFVTEVARLGLDHLVGRTEPGRVCAHCRNDDPQDLLLILPCCGRVLCGQCAGQACVRTWKTRCVMVCEDCQRAHTFEATERSGTPALKLLQ
jgi:hypothetical protein